MKYIFFLLGVFFCAKSYCSVNDINYQCTADAATGFSYEQNSWKVAQFNREDNQFIIRNLSKNDPGYDLKDEKPYGVFEKGKSVPVMFCQVFEKNQHLTCSGLGQLNFSNETGRFLKSELYGFVDGNDGISGNPKIVIGTCKPLIASHEVTHKMN